MLLFKEYHIVPILTGKKTVTRRIWKRKRVKLDAIHLAKTKMLSKQYFAKLKIAGWYVQRLGDMKEAEANTEGYETVEDFKKAWEDIHGEWDADIDVYVVYFDNVWPGIFEKRLAESLKEQFLIELIREEEERKQNTRQTTLL